MTLDEFAEAKSVVTAMLTALASVANPSNVMYGATATTSSVQAAAIVAARLYYGISDILSNVDYLVRNNAVATPLYTVCDLARQAGGMIADFERVRGTLAALQLTSAIAINIASLGIQLVLAQEVAIYAATTFTSRQQVTAAILQINDAFEGAREYAADADDPASYQALIKANAAIVNKLNTSDRPLPKMITYSVGRPMCSLVLANYLYGDASRADELVAENGIIDPHWMPLSGAALAS